MYIFPEGTRGGFGTDLALERRRADTELEGVDYKKERCTVGVWERIRITSKEGAKSIGRPEGRYDTLSLEMIDKMDAEESADAAEEVAKELCLLCDRNRVLPERILVVGLGNGQLTPDSIGVKAAERVNPTRHIRLLDGNMFDSLECSEISVICPGVTATTGLTALDTVKGICQRTMPDVVLAIDAICARSPSRLGSTLQFSDTGIFPGSGLGRGKCELSASTLGIPVFAIGVPTVMDSRMFVVENGEARPLDEVNRMFISPKDIDSLVKIGARIIGDGINQAFGIDC